MRKRYVWNNGWVLPEGSLNSESATSRAQIELAAWSTKSTKPRRKIILGTIKRFEKLRVKPWKNAVDCRILGVPRSTVEQQNTTRENKVKRLIEKFENHKHKESFIQDLRQTEKINKFSRESQDLIADLKHTEIFELCENSSKQQCPECNTYWKNRYNLLQLWKKCEIFEGTNRVREQRRRHLNPWPCYQEEQQPWSQARIFWKTKDVLPGKTNSKEKPSAKAWRPSNDTFTMVWRRRIHRKSLSAIGWKEHIILYDRMALEKHFHVATRAERIQNSKHWILMLNAEGPKQPLNQRPDFAHVKRECKRLHDEHLARTQEEY